MRENQPYWDLTEDDLDCIALGAAILGTGGGGSAYLGKLRAREQLRAGRRIRIMLPEALDDDDLIIPVGGMGAPTVGIEKTERGDEIYRSARAVEATVGKPIAALVSDEIGGSNGIEVMIAAALAELPVIDADPMGRAFPELQMNTFSIYGLPASPAALSDEKGNTVVFRDAITTQWLEKLARATTIAMGCTAGLAFPPVNGWQLKQWGVLHTVSQAWRLGQLVLAARAEKRDPLQAILAHENGRLLFRGKIMDVARWTTGGFARGHINIDGFDDFSKQEMRIEFQNENLVARVSNDVVAMVPDLICVVDTETGRPISTEELRYGLRVAILGLPCTPLFRTSTALQVIGPRAFGYDLEYRPLGQYAVPQVSSRYAHAVI